MVIIPVDESRSQGHVGISPSKVKTVLNSTSPTTEKEAQHLEDFSGLWTYPKHIPLLKIFFWHGRLLGLSRVQRR